MPVKSFCWCTVLRATNPQGKDEATTAAASPIPRTGFPTLAVSNLFFSVTLAGVTGRHGGGEKLAQHTQPQFSAAVGGLTSRIDSPPGQLRHLHALQHYSPYGTHGPPLYSAEYCFTRCAGDVFKAFSVHPTSSCTTLV